MTPMKKALDVIFPRQANNDSRSGTVPFYGLVFWQYRDLIPLMFAFMVVEGLFGFVAVLRSMDIAGPFADAVAGRQALPDSGGTR